MQLSVGTTPVPLDLEGVGITDVRESGVLLLVQCQGPGRLFFDFVPGVTAATGFEVPAGGYEFPRMTARKLWFVSDMAGTDVRYVAVD